MMMMMRGLCILINTESIDFFPVFFFVSGNFSFFFCCCFRLHKESRYIIDDNQNVQSPCDKTKQNKKCDQTSPKTSMRKIPTTTTTLPLSSNHYHYNRIISDVFIYRENIFNLCFFFGYSFFPFVSDYCKFLFHAVFFFR